MDLKDTVKQILTDETESGGAIDDVVKVLTVDESFQDVRKFIVITPLPELIADNGDNHFSLVNQDVEIMIVENDEQRDAAAVIESIIGSSDNVRLILRRNPKLSGFALYTSLSSVYIAQLELIDGIARHGGKIVLHAQFFKEEAA